jgi:electron transfer DM13
VSSPLTSTPARVMSYFSGHPLRIGAAAMSLLIVTSVAWYLGSPLFIRTYRNEALPAPPISTPLGSAQPTAGTGGPTAIAGPRVLAMGELNYVDAIHNGKGPVRILDAGGQRLVRFEEVAITNAPDVHVYLSPETGGKWSEATSLYLGALKATNGSFNYDVPANAEVTRYRSVVVWCRAFSVLITWADLT